MAISSPRLQLPTESEIELSQISSRILSAHLRGATRRLKVVEEDGSEETVEIPASALHLLVDILAEMAQGNAVTLIPIHAELTTQESADILNVSRPFLIKLLDSGEIPCRMVGKHRRIRFQDLMDYKQKTDEARIKTLDALAYQAQDLGMGY